MEENVTLLVVEDEKAIASALSLKLKKEGFNVLCAYDGLEALECMRKEKINLVLLDLIIPKVDGFGVLAGMKKEGIKLPTIVSSNLSQKEDIEKALSLGAIDYFIKSDTSITEVVNHVKNALKG